MGSLRQKLRNVFSWQHDDYTFEAIDEVVPTTNPPENPPDVVNENKSGKFLKGSSSKMAVGGFCDKYIVIGKFCGVGRDV
ncbi:AGAP013087-PA-like protein [Anopheles sinensis]|uniref:AGAP013087-PA-like protein n=1 Tax=Anopheles sinensis TaxID=74873 RepID=A0A084WR89_ANOSI|nr:AGAP013087-PA-like protein [Anopheles sinensis]